MKALKRILSIIFIAILLFSFASCSKVGSGHVNKDKVLTCSDGKNVTYDEYRYYYMNYRSTRPDATDKELHELVLHDLAHDRAITSLAKEYGVKLSDESEDKLNEYIQGLIDEKGEEGYKEYLAESYMTGDVFRYTYSQKLLESELRTYLTLEMNNIIDSTDAVFEEDLYKNFMAAKQILILNNEGDDIETNRAAAEKIYADYLAGEDFDTLVDLYSEEDIAYHESGRYFTKGQMIEEYEEAVLSVKEGEVYNGVLESEIGFHIIMRLPLDPEYVDEHYNDLRELYKERRCNELIDAEAEKITFTKVKDFDGLDFE